MKRAASVRSISTVAIAASIPQNSPSQAPSIAGVAPRLILLPEVLHRTQIARSTLYALIDRELFPRPVNLTPKRVAWVEAEVDRFIADRIAARDQAVG